jgi:hypothetical protein
LTGATEPAPKTKPKTIIVPKDMLKESEKLLSEAFHKSMKKQFKLETI